MFSRLTRSLLFISSWSLEFLLWAALAGMQHAFLALWVLLLLAIVGLVMLYAVLGETIPRQATVLEQITLVRNADRDIICYALLSAVLFLLLPSPWHGSGQALVFVGMLLFVGMLYVQGNCIAVNPLLLFLGFHLYQVEGSQAKHPHYILSRQRLVAETSIQVAHLGNSLFLCLGSDAPLPDSKPTEHTDSERNGPLS